MDTLRDVIYRGFVLNDADIRESIDAEAGIGKGIEGSVIDSWDFSDVDVVQFLEKRSQQDGMDAGDVFLGSRRLRMAGTLYGKTRPRLFDLYWDLRAALSPVLAQREEPADKGYRPLYFGVPTNRVDDFPSGIMDLRVLALPRAMQAVWQRDQQGGEDTDALALPWQATFLQKDPSIMLADETSISLTAGGTIAGDFNNRGSYLAPLNMLLVVGTAAGSIAVTAGGSVFTITVPSSTGNRTIRYKGVDKLLTVEENSVETLRMDLLSFANATTHPAIPPGVSPYTVTFTTVTPTTGSRMWFWETLA